MVSTLVFILLPFLSVALHESGNRNALLGSWPINTEVHLTPFIRLKITQMQDKGKYLINIYSLYMSLNLFTIIEQPTENKLFTLNMIFQWVVHW